MNFFEPLCPPGGDDCTEVQKVRFGANEQGEKAVFNIDETASIPGAFGFLRRQGDAIQFVIKTKIDT